MAVNQLLKGFDAPIDDRWVASDEDAGRYAHAADMLSEKMPTLVKGAGYARPGGNTPLTDDDKIFKASMKAERTFLKSMKDGIEDPAAVIKSLSPEFSGHFGAFLAASPQNQQMARIVDSLSSQISQAIGKSVTLTSPLGTGFVPFNLVSPSRLIYPVYSPIRNKIPRTPGQGTSFRAKVISGVSGSQTGPSGGAFLDLAIPELVQSGGTFSNWPLNLPGAGTQDAVDLNLSYKFFGMSENLSWLAQFSGRVLALAA
jgi:hypothetical protein